MKTSLKLDLENAIQSVIDKNCEEDNMWDELIHPELVEQMTLAAVAVFDASQDAQHYYEQENE